MKRVISLLLSLVLVFSFLPLSTAAYDENAVSVYDTSMSYSSYTTQMGKMYNLKDSARQVTFEYALPKDGVTILLFFRASGDCQRSNNLLSSLYNSRWTHDDRVNTIGIESSCADYETTKTFMEMYDPNNLVDEVYYNPRTNRLAYWYYTLIQHSGDMNGLTGVGGNIVFSYILLVTNTAGGKCIRYELKGVDSPSIVGYYLSSDFGIDVGNSSVSFTSVIVPGEKKYDQIDQVYQKVNYERDKASLSSVSISGELTRLAMQRAAECAVYFSHTRPNGYSAFAITPSGYYSQGYLLAENIAVGYADGFSVVAGWMNSDGHRRNILNERHTQMGVGCFENNGSLYWVQIFGNGSDTSTPVTKNIIDDVTVSCLPEFLDCHLSDAIATLSITKGERVSIPTLYTINHGEGQNRRTHLRPYLNAVSDSITNATIARAEYEKGSAVAELYGVSEGTGELVIMADEKGINQFSIPMSVTRNGPRSYSNVQYTYPTTKHGYRKASFDFEDEWLLQDPATYNHKLAIASLALAMSAMEIEEKNNYDKSQKDANIISLFKGLGFEVNKPLCTTVGFGAQDDSDRNTVAFAISTKTVADIPVIAIVLRGGGYGDGGWMGNFLVTKSGYHSGFELAAKYAEQHVSRFLSDNKIDNRQVRVWVTGYSRSAAIANLLAEKLVSDGYCNNEHLYAYTFATPNNRAAFSRKQNNKLNVYNIVSQIDIVPQVPLSGWDMTKNGTSVELLSPTTATVTQRTKMEQKFADLSGGEQYGNIDKQKLAVNVLTTLLSRNLSRENYTTYLQEPLRRLKESKDFNPIIQMISGNTLSVSDLALLNPISGAFDMLIIKAKLSAAKAASPSWAKSLIKDLSTVISDAYFVELPIYKITGKKGSNILFLGMLLDLVKKIQEDKTDYSDLLIQHWPEAYMAWMKVMDSDMPSYSNDWPSYSIATVACPVNVEVYDSQNMLVGRTVADSVRYTDENGDDQQYDCSKVDESVTTLETAVIGDCKLFLMPNDQEYSVRIITNEFYKTGDTLTYSVMKCTQGVSGAAVVYEDIPLKSDSVFEAFVPVKESIEKYTLEQNRVGIQPTTLYTQDGVVQHQNDPSTTPVSFTDVKAGSYYEKAVTWAVNHNPQITNGLDSTHFGHDKTCTRGQVVTFLWRAAGEPEPTRMGNPFTDVKSSSYYYKAVLWAVENGITTGATATTFNPEGSCTRAQVVTFLHRTAGNPEPTTSSSKFTDILANQYYAKPVLWAVESGVTTGLSNTTFGPNNTCTRGQIVTFLWRAAGQPL